MPRVQVFQSKICICKQKLSFLYPIISQFWAAPVPPSTKNLDVSDSRQCQNVLRPSKAGSAAFGGILSLLRGSIYPLGGFFVGVPWGCIAGSSASPAYASICVCIPAGPCLAFQKPSLLVTHLCPPSDTPPPPAGSRVLTVPFWPPSAGLEFSR